ncbi:MAG: hypothetical protein ACI33P_04420 [Lysinibacillus sp.]
MTKQVTLHHPLQEEMSPDTQNLLFISNFQFSFRELFKELPRDVVGLLHSLLKQFADGEESFYQTVNEEKKWEAMMRKYAHYKVKNTQFEEVLEELIQFFNEHNSATFIMEIAHYFLYASYQTEDEKTWLLFDDYDGEKPVPFTKALLTDGKFEFHNGPSEKVTLSAQAVVFIRLLDYVLSNRLEKFKIKAAIDPEMPEHIQLPLHICNDQKKSNTYFLSPQKPLTSILEIFISHLKLLRLLADYLEETDHQETKIKVKQYMLTLQPSLYRLATTSLLMHSNTEHAKEEKAAANAKKKYDEAVQKLDKQKEKYEELKKQHAELKKGQKEALQAPQAVPSAITQEYGEKIKSLTEERDRLQKLMQQLETSNKLDEKRFLEEIDRLKEENKGLQQKLQPLLKISNEPKIETIEQWLALGKTLINNIDENEAKEIRAFFELFMQIMDEQKAALPKRELATNLYGYVSISSKAHQVNFPNGQSHPIEGLPANIYLADGQFVQVTDDYTYVCDYQDFFDFHLKENSAQFSIVRMKEDTPHVYSNGELKALRHEDHVHLREGQIVSFNTQHELIRFYKQQRFHLNTFEQSIALKKHIPYYVQKALPTGAVVTNVLTSAEKYLPLENGENLQDGSFFTAGKNEEVVRIFHGSFYKLSSYYKKAEIVSVCEVDDEYFGKKLSREIVIIKNIPLHVTITLHDNVRIDEFNNYLEIVRDESSEGETLEQRLSRRPNPATSRDIAHSTIPETSTTVLIVGNPSFFNSYTQKLSDYGYDVTGIEGYESFTRIKQAAKDKDSIVVCTEFVSHDNMYAIKDYFPASKVLYSEREGATQIALQLKSANM